MDLLTLLLVIAPFVLMVWAVVSIAGHPGASGLEKAVWIAIALLVPLLGPIIWFGVGRTIAGRQALG